MFGFGFIFVRSRKKQARINEDENWNQAKEARLKALLQQDDDGDKQ